jgi:uncharacterized membrane protein HdeD (DUF308 family)
MTAQTVREKIQAHITGELPVNWGVLMTLGVLMVVLGTMGIIWAPIYSIGVAMIFGAFLMAAGIVQLVSTFSAGEKNWKGKIVNILVAIIYIIGGGVALFNPPAAAAGLTLVMASLFLAIGVIRIVYGFQQRKNGWAWVWPVVSGLIDIAIAVILIMDWPISGIWAPGLFFAIELLMNGWFLIATAIAARNAINAAVEA